MKLKIILFYLLIFQILSKKKGKLISKIDVKKAQPKSEQKTKNILFQSGVDVVLNNYK